MVANVYNFSRKIHEKSIIFVVSGEGNLVEIERYMGDIPFTIYFFVLFDFYDTGIH